MQEEETGVDASCQLPLMYGSGYKGGLLGSFTYYSLIGLRWRKHLRVRAPAVLQDWEFQLFQIKRKTLKSNELHDIIDSHVST